MRWWKNIRKKSGQRWASLMQRWPLRKGGRKSRLRDDASVLLGDDKPWDMGRTLARVRVVGVVVALVTVGVGWFPAERALHELVKQAHPLPPGAKDVVLLNRPGWMPEGLVVQIQKLVAERCSADPLDRGGLERVVGALSANPWVSKVERVERRGGEVRVTARYRRPVALVNEEGALLLVDGQGVRLPGQYQGAQASRLKLPVITGVSAKAPAEGQLWRGDDLQAGLALVRELSGQPYAGHVRAYDVSQRDGMGRIRLVMLTQRGMVRWGLPPGQEQMIEPSAAMKKEWLSSLYRSHKKIDMGGSTVDLFGAAAMVREQPDDGELRGRYSWLR